MSQFLVFYGTVMSLSFRTDRVWANSVDPDQTAPRAGAVWSGTTGMDTKIFGLGPRTAIHAILHCENRHCLGPAQNPGTLDYRAPVKVHPWSTLFAPITLL